MKTILYNPIFINPQAYYVFPRLTRYLQPDNESTAEPANYIGTIEVKVIAYGDTTLKRTYTNTDSIDLSEFKNTWIRISLFTKVGSCVLGEWKIGNMESDLPYIDPEVLASLKAVVIVGNKTNNDSDRAVVKNLVDASNPFIISNAAYKLNSGYGKYEVDFTTWSKRNVVTSNNDNSFSFESKVSSSLLYYSTTIGVDTPSFKIKANISNCLVYYYYINDKGTLSSISILESGEFELPISHNTLYNGNIGIGFEIGRINGTGTGTITQIPSYQGAFVTDGVDDLITSTKTIGQMVGENGDYTIISMIHQISYTHETEGDYDFALTNYIRSGDGYTRSRVTNIGKTAIYGYYANPKNSDAPTYNNILGDKADLFSETNAMPTIYNDKISIQGYVRSDGLMGEFSELAWYWTIFAKGQLTTDQINQVIAYYNLDRCVEPTVLYDVKRQGLSNDTPDSDWYLKDFSKNGFDMSLFNFAKDGDSGIGKYNYPNWKVTATVAKTYSTIVNYPTVNGTYSINVSGVSEMMQSIGMHLEVKYTTPTGTIYNDIKQDGVYSYILPDGATDLTLRFGGIPGIVNEPCNITITQIPSHAGALCLDGVNDYGKVTGLPIYKDYTVVADREIVDGLAASADGGVALKGSKYLTGAFAFDYKDSCWSFGGHKMIPLNTKRFISYQSKYVSNGISVDVGTATDNDELWIGRLGNEERYSKLAIRFLMSFPYSMSEFLIERQLKKHKLGTLYPDMVEFRPIVNSNVECNTIEIWQADKPLYRPAIGTNETGTYLQKDSTIGIYVKPKDVDEVTKIVVNGTEYTNLKINSNGFYYVTLPITKSPQKIDITIYQPPQYLAMLGNETLISNETLIKNE